MIGQDLRSGMRCPGNPLQDGAERTTMIASNEATKAKNAMRRAHSASREVGSDWV